MTESTRRWKLTRCLHVERWRIIMYFRVYHGIGLPVFEFEFRFGFPKRREP